MTGTVLEAAIVQVTLVAIARLSAVEALATQIAPHAEGRLKMIADAGAIDLLTIVNDVSSS